MKLNLVSVLAIAAAARAQLSGRVGPTTPRDTKATRKVCSIMNYGGVASATADNSAAISKAWDECKNGGQVLIPSGSYGLGKWVGLSGGKGVSINLEGILFRLSSGTADGSMVTVQETDDFEFYSGNSKGAIQGYGYEFHKDDKYGPGIVKFANVTNFSIHDLALVDAPASHFTLDTCANGEVYNMIIRGGNKAGLDGIDVKSGNIWLHDIEVSNGDDCVAVKSPSNNILVESIFCNLSGGCAIGPLGSDANVTLVSYQNIYTQSSDHMLLIKSNGGSGFLHNSAFTNFTGHGNKYTLNIDAFWAGKAADPGDGVEYDDLTFTNWAGTTVDGVQYPPIQLNCTSEWFCGTLEIDDFNVWTETGSTELYKCQNAYGLGGCMNPFAGNGVYHTTVTVTATPTANYHVPTMPGEITKGLGVTTSIDIPAVPTTFYPGRKPSSTLLGPS